MDLLIPFFEFYFFSYFNNISNASGVALGMAMLVCQCRVKV